MIFLIFQFGNGVVSVEGKDVRFGELYDGGGGECGQGEGERGMKV